jgi:hypothetical protein
MNGPLRGGIRIVLPRIACHSSAQWRFALKRPVRRERPLPTPRSPERDDSTRPPSGDTPRTCRSRRSLDERALARRHKNRLATNRLPLERAVEVRVEAAGAAGVSSAGREIVKRQR